MRLISTESVLKKIPDGLKERQRLLLDGIRYAISMADLAHERLIGALEAAQDAPSSEALGRLFTSAFSDAWTIVDCVDRLRGLLAMLPDAEQTVALAEFRTGTNEVRRLRNGMQHLNLRIDQLVAGKLPTWGHLTWTTAKTETAGVLHSLMAGSVRNTLFALPLPDGRPITNRPSMVTLHAFGEEVDFERLRTRVVSLVEFLERTLAPQFEGKPHGLADTYLELAFEVGGETSDLDPGSGQDTSGG